MSNDNRNTCGTSVNSSCVPFTGTTLKTIDYSKIPSCNANINDIFTELDSVIQSIKDAINIEGVTTTCIDSCNCEENTIKTLLTTIITRLCDLTTRIKDLETIDISQSLFTVDLQCFNNPCFNSTNNQHTLLEIIMLLLSEVCILKNK